MKHLVWIGSLIFILIYIMFNNDNKFIKDKNSVIETKKRYESYDTKTNNEINKNEEKVAIKDEKKVRVEVDNKIINHKVENSKEDYKKDLTVLSVSSKVDFLSKDPIIKEQQKQLYTAIQIHYKNRDYKKVYESYYKIINLYPKDYIALTQIGWFLSASKKHG